MSAIRAAQSRQVDIINMSLGGIGYNGTVYTQSTVLPLPVKMTRMTQALYNRK